MLYIHYVVGDPAARKVSIAYLVECCIKRKILISPHYEYQMVPPAPGLFTKISIFYKFDLIILQLNWIYSLLLIMLYKQKKTAIHYKAQKHKYYTDMSSLVAKNERRSNINNRKKIARNSIFPYI